MPSAGRATGSSSTRSSAKDGPPTAGCRCACRTDSTNSSSQAGAADRLVLAPEPLTRQTAWEEVHFALRENAEAPGTCCPADELFLQYLASDADAIHTVGGADLTVAATLRRAVCRIEVSVKRGYHDGTQYGRFPMRNRNRYSARSTASNFRPEPRDCGNPAGSSGTATVAATLAAADYAELTDGEIHPARRAFHHSARRRRRGRSRHFGRSRRGGRPATGATASDGPGGTQQTARRHALDHLRYPAVGGRNKNRPDRTGTGRRYGHLGNKKQS